MSMGQMARLQYSRLNDSRKLSVMLKFIFQLGQVGYNALALVGLLIIINSCNRSVKVVNCACLDQSYSVSD